MARREQERWAEAHGKWQQEKVLVEQVLKARDERHCKENGVLPEKPCLPQESVKPQSTRIVVPATKDLERESRLIADWTAQAKRENSEEREDLLRQLEEQIAREWER